MAIHTIYAFSNIFTTDWLDNDDNDDDDDDDYCFALSSE